MTLSEHAIADSVDELVDRLLRQLRSTMQARGMSQLNVQETLGWGRTYISQLFRKQKALRVDQVLMILETLNVEPKQFFAELFGVPSQATARTLTAQDRARLTQSLDTSIEAREQDGDNVGRAEFNATVRALVYYATALGGPPIDHFLDLYRRELQREGLLDEES